MTASLGPSQLTVGSWFELWKGGWEVMVIQLVEGWKSGHEEKISVAGYSPDSKDVSTEAGES
jgi:hypothetical protein